MSNCILCGKYMDDREYMLNFHTCNDCTKGKYTTVEEIEKEVKEGK